MKQIILFLISTYQVAFPIRGHCRFSPTCSQYAKIVIEKHGVIKGGGLAVIRILSCQPLEVQSAKFKVQNYVSRLKLLTFNF